jgi:inactivated superfamily I helicase/CRISPR/Cas system-associated exonuclease Cas4 (RecB family)
MKTLHIYPTSRAIRNKRLEQKEQAGLLPSLMRVDEFERRAIILPELVMVDPLQRTLFLQEASQFEGFQALKINRELIRFFTKSDAIFKFFEELSQEQVSFDALVEGDAYVEFTEHIEILEELLANYKHLLESRGLTDRVFVPSSYRINRGFVESYDAFEFHLEGYLSYFELQLLEQIAEHKPFIVHMHTSKFNLKVQERFLEMGIALENDAYVTFDLHSKEVLSSVKNEQRINAEVFAVEERLAQIPLLLESVQKMVNSGIPADEIVVILPDESFKEPLHLYDKLNNFNFAMGFDFEKTKAYKQLESIYKHWQRFCDETQLLLKKYDIKIEEVNKVNLSQKQTVEQFFQTLDGLELAQKRDEVLEKRAEFRSIFAGHRMSVKQWMFLWLKKLSQLTLDDVRGGKVTVMGALETRGVAFKGVVVVDFNDGIVPSIPAKDNFLNSSLRQFAKLPTKNDRAALQKQLYKRILEQAEHSVIIYSKSNNKAPASYLYELGLGVGKDVKPNMALLYSEPNMLVEAYDPVMRQFDASSITWSATRLNTFLSCKRKYYYQYVLNLEAKEEEELNEGLFLHKLLEHLFKERAFYESEEEMKANIDRLLDRLLETSSPKIAYQKLLWKEKLKKFISSQIYHFKVGWRVVAREEQIVGSIGGINFKGVVDRIDQEGTSTLVLDYKSGSITEANRTKNLEKLTDFQMSIYSELLKEKFTDLTLAFVEIFNGKITEITALEEKTELLHEIIGELKATNEVVAERCEDVSKCHYCDYTLLCGRGVYL